MTRNPRQTLKGITLRLVDLAIQHDLVVSHDIIQKSFDTSNQKRRVYDAINVLIAINLCQRLDYTLYFDEQLIKLVFPVKKNERRMDWTSDTTWMHDPVNEFIMSDDSIINFI